MENANQKMKLKIAQMRSIADYIYDDAESIPVWKTRTGLYVADGTYENIEPEWSELRLGESWQARRDLVRWFSAKVTVPARFAKRRVVLNLDLGGEGLCYINGRMASAVVSHQNPAHKEQRTEVLISDCASGGEELDIL
jgi:hypothetical protein